MKFFFIDMECVLSLFSDIGRSIFLDILVTKIKR